MKKTRFRLLQLSINNITIMQLIFSISSVQLFERLQN